MLTTAMPSLHAAANAIATLPPDEADAVVTFVMDVSGAVGKAASDKGESEKVSAAEEDMLRTIENALRNGSSPKCCSPSGNGPHSDIA